MTGRRATPPAPGTGLVTALLLAGCAAVAVRTLDGSTAVGAAADPGILSGGIGRRMDDGWELGLRIDRSGRGRPAHVGGQQREEGQAGAQRTELLAIGGDVHQA